MAGEEVASGGAEVVSVDTVARAGAWEGGGGASTASRGTGDPAMKRGGSQYAFHRGVIGLVTEPIPFHHHETLLISLTQQI